MPLRHCGTQTIKTPRLILRQFTVSDYKDMYAWTGDPEVTRHLTFKAHSDLGVTRGILKTWAESYGGLDFYLWAITVKPSDVPVGTIGLCTCEGRRLCAEVGYCLTRNLWGHGIMTEALRAVLTYGLDEVGFERIQATHHVDNPASGRVMQKAGMLHEGTLRKFDVRNDGTLVDAEMYSILP